MSLAKPIFSLRFQGKSWNVFSKTNVLLRCQGKYWNVLSKTNILMVSPPQMVSLLAHDLVPKPLKIGFIGTVTAKIGFLLVFIGFIGTVTGF